MTETCEIYDLTNLFLEEECGDMKRYSCNGIEISSKKKCANTPARDENEFLMECKICFDTYPIQQCFSMIYCTHSACNTCAKKYFGELLNNGKIFDCNCPICNTPENLSSMDENAHVYYSYLDVQLKKLLCTDKYEIFQSKLLDAYTARHPLFKYCEWCHTGYISESCAKAITCPNCKTISCGQCKEIWKPQHENLSCKNYRDWKIGNDSNLQKTTVSRLLQKSGISCPKCKYTFLHSRGGCIHMTCTQCAYSFCFSCKQQFTSDRMVGLHADHPRNCLHYLGDKTPEELKVLLDNKNIKYATTFNGIQEHFQIWTDSGPYCPVAVQEETNNAWVDIPCGQPTGSTWADLCSRHYVEYLVKVINQQQLDPVSIMDVKECTQELARRKRSIPFREAYDTDPIFVEKLRQAIKQNIPLQPIK